MKRIEYLDTTKGVLMLLVILFHISEIGLSYNVGNRMINFLNKLVILYSPFFLTTFFFITGYCSSFNINFKTFIIKNIKTLLFPSFIFGLIIACIYAIQEGFIHITMYFKAIVCCGGSYWFITALFTSKIIYYFFIKILKSNTKILIAVVFLMFIAIFNNENKILKNYWEINNAFAFLFFLHLGQYMKTKHIKDYVYKIISLLYIITISLCCILQINVPILCMQIEFTYYNVFTMLIFAIAGGCFILSLSKQINNKILSYIGNNSLIIFMTHIFIIQKLTFLYELHNAFYTPFIIYFITIAITIFIAMAVNSKYLKWMKGKF